MRVPLVRGTPIANNYIVSVAVASAVAVVVVPMMPLCTIRSISVVLEHAIPF